MVMCCSESGVSPLRLMWIALMVLAELLLISAFAAAIREYMFVPDLRGIHPTDLLYYNRRIIWCKDNSNYFSWERLNDNFCDCVDGTDEPGTSACPGGKFHCGSAASSSKKIFSSRVNDGICDCCDGSDEYDGTIQCSNTCQYGKDSNSSLVSRTMKEVPAGQMLLNSLEWKSIWLVHHERQKSTKVFVEAFETNEVPCMLLLEFTAMATLLWLLLHWQRTKIGSRKPFCESCFSQ